jgi:hypothetical protein
MTFVPTPPPPAPPSQPDPPRARRFSRTQRLVMAGGLAAGLALGGAGISFAASSGSSSSSSSSTTTPANNAPAKPGHGPRGFGFGPGLPGFGGLGRVVHGQATVRTRSGGYQTIAFQVGSVAAVSSTSITVKSADGYIGYSPPGSTASNPHYVVTATTIVNAQRDGIGSVAEGDQVRVIATVPNGGGTATATNITDLSKLKSSRAGFGFGPGSGAFPDNGPGASKPAAA